MLYVGATRAIRHLHLVGVATRNVKGEVKAPANTFLDLLWPAVAEQFAAVTEAASPRVEAVATFIPRLVRLIEPVAVQLSVHEPIEPVAPATESAADEPAAQSLEARVGTLAHRYLEMVARDGLDAWPTERIGKLRGVMEIWLTQQGCGDRDAALGAERVVAILTTTLASEQGRWVLKQRDEAASEVALMKVSRGGTALNVVDRSFVEAGVRWIIDYKTAEPDEDLTARAERYRPQLERYAELFCHEGLPIRAAIFYAALGRLVAVGL